MTLYCFILNSPEYLDGSLLLIKTPRQCFTVNYSQHSMQKNTGLQCKLYIEILTSNSQWKIKINNDYQSASSPGNNGLLNEL